MVQCLVLHDIDSAPKRFLQVCDEAAGKERRRLDPGFDEEIEIAVGARLITNERSEDFDSSDAVTARDFQYSVTFRCL